MRLAAKAAFVLGRNSENGGIAMRKVFTRDDYLSIEDIRRLNEEIMAVAALRREVVGDVGVVNIVTNMGTATMATPEYINQIERNIDALAGGVPPVGMQLTRVWLGEGRDVPFLSFRDVNRWFESVALVRASLLGRGRDFRATGAYVAGDCGVRQGIRN